MKSGVVKRNEILVKSPKMKSIKSPKCRKIKIDKKDKNDKKKSIDENEDKTRNKKSVVMKKMVEALNTETVKLKNDDHKEESTVKKIKDAFEVLMENGDTHARKTPLKPRLKRCLRSKNTSGEKILMEKWLSK